MNFKSLQHSPVRGVCVTNGVTESVELIKRQILQAVSLLAGLFKIAGHSLPVLRSVLVRACDRTTLRH